MYFLFWISFLFDAINDEDGDSYGKRSISNIMTKTDSMKGLLNLKELESDYNISIEFSNNEFKGIFRKGYNLYYWVGVNVIII